MVKTYPALSIKQPWAALIVHGLKTVEIRTWATGKTGPVLIHASKSPEDDPDAWTRIDTPELMTTAGLVGGIVGIVNLVECLTYRSREEYARDPRHCTRASRWTPPRMYGFRFEKPRRVSFIPWLGNTNFFSVDADIQPQRARKLRPPAALKYIVRLPEH